MLIARLEPHASPEVLQVRQRVDGAAVGAFAPQHLVCEASQRCTLTGSKLSLAALCIHNVEKSHLAGDCHGVAAADGRRLARILHR
jgi:hypothetical protein